MIKFLSIVLVLITSSNIQLWSKSLIMPDSSEAEKYYNKANELWRDVKYDSSNIFFQKASELYEKAGNWDRLIDCERNMGINFRYLDDYPNALKHLEKALNVLPEINTNRDSLRAELYNSIGSVYYEKGDYDKAYKYYKDMLEINERIFGTDTC